MKSNSLRLRLALLSGSLALVATVAVGAVLQLHADEQLQRELTDALEEECDEVMVVLQDPRLEPFVDDFLRIETSHRFIPQRYYFQVSDSGGRLLAQSRNLEGAMLPVPARWTQTQHGQAVEVATSPNPLAPHEPVLVRSERVEINVHGRGQAVLVVQIGVSIGAWRDRVAQTLAGDAVLAAVILACVFLLIWFVVALALRPVVAMTRKAAQINANDLDERIPLAGGAEELDQLARVLNGMLDRLAESMRQTAAFSAHAAHQLRTPLTRIRGKLDLALRESMSDTLRSDLERAQDEVERLSRLCGRLLLLGRLELGARANTVMSEKVDLREVARELIEQCSPMARERGVVLGIGAEEIARICGNRMLLAEALLNLLDNAIHWTPKGGTVRLGVQLNGPEAVVSVSDTGPGVPAEQREHLFRPFFRGSQNPSGSVSEGSGMGLAIARAIARAHGGRLELVSPTGRGCTFQLILPALAADPAPGASMGCSQISRSRAAL